MILVLLGLLSLSAIYFTRFFYKRDSKMAAIAIAVLFTVIIAWIYFLFIFDVADFGFTQVQSRTALLFGSNVYSSFVDLNAEMSVLPTSILQAIVAVCMLALTAAIIVVLDGVLRVAGELYKAFKTSRSYVHDRVEFKADLPGLKMPTISLNKLYCRANC